MSLMRAWFFRFSGMFARKSRERELASELESHLQMHIQDNLRSGMSPEEARRKAVLKLGGIEPTKEACRDRGTIPFIESLLRDTRFSVRQLRRTPAFTLTAIAVLGMGIGACIALFAFVDAALIKPLPYANPPRLAGVYESVPLFPQAPLSYPDYLDWKRLNKVFSSLDVYHGSGYLLSTPAGAEPVPAVRVSDGFFRTLGVVPLLGRDFYSGEDLPAAPATVILSYAAWQNRFGGRKDILGRAIRLSGVPHTVVGVLPQSFQFIPRGGAEFWTTLRPSSGCDLRRSCHDLNGIGRLKDGVSLQTALANMKSIAKQLERQFPDSNRDQGASVLPLSEAFIGDLRPLFLVLLSGAGLLLAIACVNVASLVLVRSESRRREIAVRASLGASTMRLAGQLVTEAAVLSGTATLAGLVIALWAMRLLVGLIPPDLLARMPYLHELGLNSHVLAAAFCLMLLSGALLSLAPAFRLKLSDMRQGLSEGGRGSAANTWRRLGANLVVLELAIAMILLVGAGLLGKSLFYLLRVNLGFQPGHLALVELAVPAPRYPNDPQLVTLSKRLLDQVRTLPGVKSAAITNLLPVGWNGNTDWIRIVGHPYHGEHNEVNQRAVSADYFRTLGARLLRGRFFTAGDDASKPRVIIVNEALARKYFPGEDPVGKRIADDDLTPQSFRQIVGVVDDVREGSLDADIWPAEYLAFSQSPETDFALVLRTSQSEQAILPALSAAVRKIDPEIGTIGETTMNNRIGESPAAYLHRSSAWLVGGFAALALLLSVVGLYGVVAYSVGQRTREIGVRMALGAEARSVYRLVLKEASWLAALGVVIGLFGSVAAAALMRNLLFSVRSWDMPTLGAVAALLAVSALLASYMPARRAASINPVDALRAE